MKWATRALIHFDRVASAWLIFRFVDKSAEFLFLREGEKIDSDVIPFALPGAALASHNGETTTFQRILDAHSIADAGLTRLAALVASVVDHVMKDRDRTCVVSRDPLVGGVLAVAEGAMLLSATDGECLKRSIPLYDALYARLTAQLEIERRAPSPPAAVLEQTLKVARAADALRRSRTQFSSGSFADALRADSSTN